MECCRSVLGGGANPIFLVFPVFVLVAEPIFESYRELAKIFLRERLIIPDNKLHDAKMVRERKVYQKVESSILWDINRVYNPL